MIIDPSSIFQKRYRRGSVIVLVVAVLGLLAVIGTVYIVSSRTERQSAGASAIKVNLDFTRDAVLSQVVDVIGRDNIDAAGVVGGYNVAGPFGTQAARRWTMPELGTTTVGIASYNTGYRDDAWLVSNLYRTTLANSYLGTSYNDLSLLTPFHFNPQLGTYDSAFPYNSSSTTFRVVDPFTTNNIPNTANSASAFYAPTDDAYIQLLPYSEASGIRYRYGVRIIDTNRMANLNVGAAIDSTSGLDSSGTYLGSYALAHPDLFNVSDTATMGNLDAAWGRVGGAAALTPLPTPLTSLYYTWSRVAMGFERPDTFGSNVFVSPFSLDDEMELRSYGDVGTSFTPRVAMTSLWPNTLSSNNVHRGNYTTYSYSRELRPFSVPADANVFTGALNNAYTVSPLNTAWSFTAAQDPQPLPGVVWPPFPARVAANPDISSSVYNASNAVADSLAMAATNIATAMEFAIRTGTPATPLDQYTHQEACSFAANYITYRWNGWSQPKAPSTTPTTIGGTGYKNFPATTPVMTLSCGPSLIDNQDAVHQGICVRSLDVTSGLYFDREYGSPTDIGSERVGKVYLAYAAQPFINEIAETVHSDGVATVAISDAAIELYNPYNVGLNLDDYKLYINATTTLDLSGNFIPPRGYFVIYQQAGGHLSTKVAADAQQITVATLDLTTSSSIYLMRKFFDRNNLVQYGAVDQYNVTTLNAKAVAFETPVPAAGDTDFYVRRSNNDPVPTLNTDWILRWSAVVHNPAVAELAHQDPESATETLTLGAVNNTEGATGIPLYDRYVDSGLTQRLSLLNIDDFNRVMRISNEIDMLATPAGAPATSGILDNGLITTKLASIQTAIPVQVANSQFPVEASIHFDFRAAPWLYNVAGFPNETASPGPPYAVFAPGDLRAVHLLECLASVDRASDFNIDIGDNSSSRGISKIRIPGQININTASPEVLSSIPILNANPQYVGAILAYRWRTKADVNFDSRIPTKYQGPGFDFTNTTGQYPGYGFRSLAELNVALSSTGVFTTPPSTLYQRDQLWADVYNQCTVRSDTFVLYGYIEAVKANPNYINGGNPHNNAGDWYGSAVDDARGDTADPNIRVARRRFIALIDRSSANANRVISGGGTNANFTSPRVIAIKDLPQ